jgi:hypothetical protein
MKGATGGLLRQIGSFGVLLVKDFTSVLAMNRDARAEARAALREVYDGAWARPVGTDGGRVLECRGKCGLVGAVTPVYDQYLSAAYSPETYAMTSADSFLSLSVVNRSLSAFASPAPWPEATTCSGSLPLSKRLTGVDASGNNGRSHSSANRCWVMSHLLDSALPRLSVPRRLLSLIMTGPLL